MKTTKGLKDIAVKDPGERAALTPRPRSLVRRKVKTVRTLGAATDDPIAIVNRAVRQAHHAEADGDADGLRQAAEMGWLAVSSLADVAAARLGRPAPGGASARREALRALESEARLRRGTFTHSFELARLQLHGECFHGDSCPINLVDELESYRAVVTDGMNAVARIRRRKR